MRLYAEIADWWPLFSCPQRYAEEAAWILAEITKAIGSNPAAILELGSGGGNTASHLTQYSQMTLTDLSEAMLAVSRRLNPDAEHLQGDMRTLRLDRTFDAVLIHDAIMYMTTESDLVAALATARIHLREGGALIVLPDYVSETFMPKVDWGGHDAADGSGRGLRYMAWTHPPAGEVTAHDVDYAIMLREADGSVRVVHDRHRQGLFERTTWRQAFISAGLAPPRVSRDSWKREVFVAKPQSAGHDS